MANPFLNKTDLVDRDLETAILLEKAIVTDIGRAVAYTDGDKIFINTDDNLFEILPAYDQRMLKWLLWHEKMHMKLSHHNRFFKYLKELSEEETIDEFQVTKEEVNIIMDILVHDSLSKMFPELVETAVNNCAQMRNRNSLSYTFKTYTLEEMLDEYAKHKHGEDKEEGEGTEAKEGEESEEESEGGKSKKSHGEGSTDTPEGKDKEESEDGDPELDPESERPASEPSPLPDEHDKTDWSKLDDIDSKEFITEEESEHIQKTIEEIKRNKFKLARLTETLNGLVTSARKRSYVMPSTIHVGGGILLKGSTPGRTSLYLVFDASGSMSGDMNTFKHIISKSIPQAMDTTTEWFAGYDYEDKCPVKPYKTDMGDGYYKGKFKDFMPIYAHSGYSDDGDRTIELCYEAEQKGYTPIGVTDGGGRISWATNMLKQLKRTVFVGQNSEWLKEAKKINPTLQTICTKGIREEDF